MSRSRFPFALSLCLIAWLFTTGTAVAEREVNDTFIPPGPVISGQSYDSTPATDAPAGTFSFISTFCNSNGPEMLDGLESRTVTLTNNNVLLNRNMTTSTAPGVGSRLFFPATGDYTNLSLPVGQCVPVEYRIGLQTSDRFQFVVDTWLAPPVILSMTAPSPVREGELVHLHAGMAPLDAGETPTFAWLQDSGPSVALMDADTANPHFIAPGLQKPTKPTTLVFQLTATLNGRSQVGLIDVDVDAGKIAVDAGPDQSAVVGHAVNLHVVSTPVVKKWEWVQTLGDPVVLTGARTANPSFTAPATGQGLEFEARTKVGSDTGADRVLVTAVRKTALAAHAGGDLNAVIGDTVTLNCTVDGGSPTTQGWTQVPNGAPTVSLSGADTLTATFVAPNHLTPPILEFECSAIGPDGHSEDRLQVTVTPPTIPLSVKAGRDQDVLEGDRVYLQGAGSGGTTPLSYAWTQVTSEPITITGADTRTPSFDAPDVSGDTPVTLEVTVTDSASSTPATDRVTYTVKERTVRVTTSLDQHATSGGDVHLSAQPVGGVPPYTYSWSQTSTGTQVTLNNPGTDNPDFTAPSVTADETLTFDVVVTGALHNTGTGHASVLVKAAVRPLEAHAGKDMSFEPLSTASLHGSGEHGTSPYTYAWTSVPHVTLSSATVESPTYTQPDGDVTFTLTVTDSNGDTGSDDVTVKKGLHRKQVVCGKYPPFLCNARYEPDHLCDIDKPWGLISFINNKDASITVERKCGTTTECQLDWWVSSSDADPCTTFKSDALINHVYSCTYCCGGDNCTAGEIGDTVDRIINHSPDCNNDIPPTPPAPGAGTCNFIGWTP